MTGLALRHTAVDRFPALARFPVRLEDAKRPAYLRPVIHIEREDEVTKRLQAIGNTVTHARGKTIVHDGDDLAYVYKVVSGTLRAVRLLPDGRRYITGFRLPGDFFGFTDNTTAADTIEVVRDATLIRYPRRAFENVLQAHAPSSRHFFDLVCQELCAAQDRLLMLGRKNAVERMATFLLTIADRLAGAGSRMIVDLPVTRADMADYLGLTIETVSRLLSQLRRRRIIQMVSPTHIVFLDRSALEAIRNAEG